MQGALYRPAKTNSIAPRLQTVAQHLRLLALKNVVVLATQVAQGSVDFGLNKGGQQTASQPNANLFQHKTTP